MVTRSKYGISKPMVLIATKHPLPSTLDLISTISSLPTTYKQASKLPYWQQAMQSENGCSYQN